MVEIETDSRLEARYAALEKAATTVKSREKTAQVLLAEVAVLRSGLERILGWASEREGYARIAKEASWLLRRNL